MLSLQRRKGEKVYIGDELLTVLDFDDHNLTVKYQDDIHHIKFDDCTFIAPEVVICYTLRKGNTVRFNINGPLPIYREEIYEQRNMK